MKQLEERLRRNLAVQAARFPALPPEELPGPEPAHRLAPSLVTVRRGFSTLIAAALVVMLVLGGSLWLLRNTGDETVGDSTPPTGADPSLRWQRSDFLSGDWTVGQLAAGPAGILAVGLRQYEVRVWLSTDGWEWLENSDVLGGGVVVRGVAAGDYGYLIVGLRLEGGPVTTVAGAESEDEAPTVWYSPDGVTWTESGLPLPAPGDRIGESVDYVVGPAAGNGGGFVVVGDEIDNAPASPGPAGEDEGPLGTVHPSRPVAWRSTDGVNWDLAEEPGWEGASSAGSVAASGDRFVLELAFPEVGSELWTSTDGSSWERGHQYGPGAFVTDLAAGSGGFAAIVDDALWYSVDAATWERPPALTSAGWAKEVIATTDGFIVVVQPGSGGTPDPGGLVAESTLLKVTPGHLSEPPASLGTFVSGYMVSDVAVFDDITVVVGGRREDPGNVESTPEVWTGTPDD